MWLRVSAIIFQLFKLIMLEKSCVLTILEINWNQRLGHKKKKLNICHYMLHVVHTTAKQVISRRRKNENVCEMWKIEKRTCKACKNTVFQCQICKFVGVLLPSSSWLLKLPIDLVFSYTFEKKRVLKVICLGRNVFLMQWFGYELRKTVTYGKRHCRISNKQMWLDILIWSGCFDDIRDFKISKLLSQRDSQYI